MHYPFWFPIGEVSMSINTLRTKLFPGNIKMYLQFISFLHTDMTQVAETPPRVRQELTCFI